MIYSIEGDVGSEKEMAKLVELQSKLYRPGAAAGFCIGAGSIVDKRGMNEQTSMVFRHRQIPLEVSVRTQQIGKYLSDYPLEQFVKGKSNLQKEGICVQVLKDLPRKVGGLQGQEGRVRLTSRKEGDSIKYLWFSQGKVGDPLHPEILIEAFGPYQEQRKLDEIWEALQRSWRPRPAQ